MRAPQDAFGETDGLSEAHTSNPDVLEQALSLLAVPRGDLRFLDAGCRLGRAADFVRSRGWAREVVAIAEQGGFPLSKLGTRRFDRVFLADGIVDAEDPVAFLAALRGFAVEGGLVGCLLARYAENRGLELPPAARGQAEWRSCFRRSGFEVVRQERLHARVGAGPDWLVRYGSLGILAVA
ncbi:MAG: hypothetical protein AAFU79_08340 [Myxococcota bacterium]